MTMVRWGRWMPLLAAALSIAAASIWMNALQLQPVDDAFISFRAAVHLAQGQGPVFNPGERVESATSPLWVALLALLSRLGIDPTSSAVPLGLLAAGGGAALSAALAAELAGPLAALLAAITLAALPAWNCWPGTGMEIPLAGLAIAAATLVALRARSRRGAAAAGALAAAAALARPEAIVVVPVVVWAAGVAPRDQRGRAGAALIAAGLPLAAMFIARRVYFGAWVPNTYVAKREGLGLEALWRGASYVVWFALFHAALLFAVARAALRGGPSRLLAALCLAFAGAVVWDGGDHFPWGRLLAPALPVACALLGSELVVLPRRAITVPAALVASLVLQFVVPDRFPVFGPRRGRVRLWAEGGVVRYAIEAGHALATLPQGRVATLVIGAVGYFSGQAILDMVGLADAHIARTPHLPGIKPGHDHADVDYVLASRPEWVLFVPQLAPFTVTPEMEDEWLVRHQDYFLAALLLERDPRFRRDYRALDVRLDNGRHLRIWRRADLR